MAALADAQYIPAFRTDTMEMKDPGKKYWDEGNTFKHLEVSVSLGTTGIGIDVATPICDFIQVRLGYDHMLPFKRKFEMPLAGGGQAARQYDEKGNRKVTPFNEIAEYMYQQTGYEMEDHIQLDGKLTMNNLKLLFDIYPLAYNKHLHVTAGIYWGPQQFAKAEKGSGADVMLSYMASYNKMYDEAAADDPIRKYGRLDLYPGDYSHDFVVKGVMYKKGTPFLLQPDEDGTVRITAKSWSVKPYLGVGYTGRLIKSRDDWKVSAALGVLFWGGTPLQQTQDGTDLSEDICNVKGTLGHSVALVEALKIYPVLSVRIAKTLF
jgi:hypothetical protein